MQPDDSERSHCSPVLRLILEHLRNRDLIA